MPNHISNKLTLHCEAESATKILSEISGTYDDGEARPFDFDTLLPYPKHFADADRKRDEWEKANKGASWADAPKDGFNSGGYEWCRDNWGTKWNAYNQKILGQDSLYFETAWCTPKPVFDKLAAKYPDISFTVEYADEDIGHNAGVLKYKAIKISESLLDGTDAVRLYFGLNPESDPKDYGYNPETFEYVGDDEDAA